MSSYNRNEIEWIEIVRYIMQKKIHNWKLCQLKRNVSKPSVHAFSNSSIGWARYSRFDEKDSRNKHHNHNELLITFTSKQSGLFFFNLFSLMKQKTFNLKKLPYTLLPTLLHQVDAEKRYSSLMLAYSSVYETIWYMIW